MAAHPRRPRRAPGRHRSAGAWVDTVAETVLRQRPYGRLHLDKGSHIVVPQLYDHGRAYILQAFDGRVGVHDSFSARFHPDRDDDQSFAGDPAIVVPTEAEIDYLCSIVSTYFRVSIVTADAVWALPGGNFAYDAIATLVERALWQRPFQHAERLVGA